MSPFLRRFVVSGGGLVPRTGETRGFKVLRAASGAYLRCVSLSSRPSLPDLPRQLPSWRSQSRWASFSSGGQACVNKVFPRHTHTSSPKRHLHRIGLHDLPAVFFKEIVMSNRIYPSRSSRSVCKRMSSGDWQMKIKISLAAIPSSPGA